MAGKMKALQLWCQKNTTGYKDVNVVNMTTSWRDGLAFCALIHHYRPDLIDFDSLSKENIFQNNQLAFQTAEDELGIPALLDAEDMVAMKVPDKLSIITYVSQYYNCLSKLKPQENVLKRSGSPSKGPEQVEVKRKPVLTENVFKQPFTPSPALSEKQQTVSTCEICKKKVHLVERYIDEGKLYHRQCHRRKSLGNMYRRGQSSPFHNATADLPPQSSPSVQSNTMSNPFKETNDLVKVSRPVDNSSATAFVQSNTMSNPFKETNDPVKVSLPVGNSNATASLPDGKRNFSSAKQPKPAKAPEEISKHTTFSKEIVTHANISKSPVPDGHNRRSKVLEMAFAYDKSNSTNKLTVKQPKSEPLFRSPVNSNESKNVSSRTETTPQHSTLKNPNLVSPKNISNTASQELEKDAPDSTQHQLEKRSTETSTSNSEKDQSVKLPSSSPVKVISTSDSVLTKTIANAEDVSQNSEVTSKVNSTKQGTNAEKNKRNFENHATESSDGETGDMLPSLLESLTTAARRRPITTSESSTTDADDTSPSAIAPLISELPRAPSRKLKTKNDSFESSDNDLSTPPSAKPRSKNSSTEPLISELPKPSAKPRSRGGSKEGSDKERSKQPQSSSLKRDHGKPIIAPNQYDHSLNPFGESDATSTGISSSDDVEQNDSYDDALNPFGADSSEEHDIDEIEVSKPKKSFDNNKISLNPFEEEDDDVNATVQPDGKQLSRATSETKLRTQTVNITSARDKRLNPFTEEYEVKKQLSSPVLHSRKKAHAPPPPPKAAVEPSGSAAKPSPKTRLAAPNWKSDVEKKMEEMNEINETDNRFVEKSPVSSNQLPGSKLTKHLQPKSPSRRGNIHSPQKKQPKTSRPAPGFGFPLVKRRVKSQMTEEEIMSEMAILDIQLKDLENKGVKLEEVLRDEMELGAELKSESDQVLGEWFDLVHEKNKLVRRETDLVFLMRQQRLEQEHADVEFKIRKLLNKPDAEKTDEEKEDESQLLEQLMDIVERRNTIINSIEEARVKEEEEDAAYDRMKLLQTDSPNESEKKKKKIKMKKIFSKRKKSPKHQASSPDLPGSPNSTSHS